MRKAKAFTLIELLVVIAIIALLMAILIPVLGAVRKQAQTIACQANERQLGQLFSMYTDDHNGKLFYRKIDDWPYIWSSRFWYLQMWSYWHKSSDIFLCKAASRYVLPVGASYVPGATFQAWYAYAGTLPPSQRDIVGSYGLNDYAYDVGNSHTILATNHADEFWGTCRVNGGSTVPMLFDSTYMSADLRESSPPPPLSKEHGEAYGCIISRHNSGINMLFMDWSVRKVGLKELWTLKWHRKFNTSGPWTKAGGVKPEDWPEWMRKFKDY